MDFNRAAMTYNYSIEYLGRNQTMVQKLLRVAQSGEVLAFDFEDWASMNGHRHYISGLIANMARNLEAYQDLRTKLRTWTAMENGTYKLFVGIPAHTLSGRPPGRPKETWTNSYIRSDIASMGEEYTYPNSWEFTIEDTKLVGTITNLPAAFKRARFHVPGLEGIADPSEGVKFFGEVFENTPWRVVGIDGLYVKLERR